jgi:DNA-binding MarR family transcriptional regulator
MSTNYLEIVSLLGRLHCQFLHLIGLEINRLSVHDINNVQAMMLFKIGDAEMSVGELTLRGCFLGSNVCYSLKKMVENGYLVQQRSEHDRRSTHVRLTDKGYTLRDRLSEMLGSQIEMLAHTQITEADLQDVLTALRGIEPLWIRASKQIKHRLSTGRDVGEDAGRPPAPQRPGTAYPCLPVMIFD